MASTSPNFSIRRHNGCDASLPILLGGQAVADLLGVSRRTLHRLNASGLLPTPIRIAGTRSVRWRLSDLQQWVGAGCPAGTDSKREA